MNSEYLRSNQKEAIQISKDNDFTSGIHYHATGTGKSWIAMYLLHEFHTKYPNKNILWICEKKDILLQQFSYTILQERGFDKLLTQFNVLNFVSHKPDKWYESVNSAKFWGKPFLCIINRSFLTSQQKYKNIKSTIDLVIHDECHSIENTTTQEFYKWLQEHNNNMNIQNRFIGFSATPELVEPLTNILSKYSVYDGYLDKVILPPKIVWIKGEKNPSTPELLQLIQKNIEQLPYKKIIVWCGMIEECIHTATAWKSYFPNYTFCIDFNNIQQTTNEFSDFDTFYKLEKEGILFCAVKHREGSDIPNIDGCIFMDLVEKRSERVFIQCMGRVLRKDKDGRKNYGLIIDLKAKSTIELCNRIQYYLKLENIFPWNYTIERKQIGDKLFYINMLDMVENQTIDYNDTSTDTSRGQKNEKIYTKEDILSCFVRDIPKSEIYEKRLNYEITLILDKQLFGNMVKALDILKLTKDIPHVTRGSCGSSLVCYLLGISHVDPVKYNISFARFINQYRDTLPDIDFDFPHYLRDEVFLKLFQKWGNKVARISNHNYYHEKSALRESLRRNGVRKFISKYDLCREIKSYDQEFQDKIFTTQQELEGTFRGYSLHCGGIVYYSDGIPSDKLLERNNSSIIPQVNSNKIDVSEDKHFKIDILSSRGLSQLYYCHHFQEIDFSQHIGDKKTIDLLSSGDNIGITLAETPLMRKALLLVKPTSVLDLAICLAIIRPAAKDAKQEFELGCYNENSLVFDDDIIQIISKLVRCDEELADKIRRGYCKEKKECMDIIQEHLDKQSVSDQRQIKGVLQNLRKYGFCKAHALSYAQLVWQLAYQKAHHPETFWKSTLKNVKSCYRNWVHLYEARCHNVVINSNKHKSIYAIQRKKRMYTLDDSFTQLQQYGYWDMKSTDFYDDCYGFTSNEYYIFKGLIAFSRMISYGKKRKIAIHVGIGSQKYIEVTVTGNFHFDSRKVIIKGKGKKLNNVYGTVQCIADNIEFM